MRSLCTVWVISLLAWQALGLVHHIQHAPTSDARVTSQAVHDGPAVGAGLFDAHDDAECRLLDQVGLGDLWLLPVVQPTLLALAATRPFAFACAAALVGAVAPRSRGPPDLAL